MKTTALTVLFSTPDELLEYTNTFSHLFVSAAISVVHTSASASVIAASATFIAGTQCMRSSTAATPPTLWCPWWPWCVIGDYTIHARPTFAITQRCRFVFLHNFCDASSKSNDGQRLILDLPGPAIISGTIWPTDIDVVELKCCERAPSLLNAGDANVRRGEVKIQICSSKIPKKNGFMTKRIV